MKIVIPSIILALAATFVSAEIPQPVIDECNNRYAESYSYLPVCLKLGAVSYEMLEIAKQDDFYGPGGIPAIEGCRQVNETFAKSWMCFRDSARSAVETRSLIGENNMRNACFLAISDSDVLSRLKARELETNKKYSTGGVDGFFSTDWKCSTDLPTKEESDTLDGLETEPKPDQVKEAEKSLSIYPESCNAFTNIEQIISENSIFLLEEIWSTMEGNSVPNNVEKLIEVGVLRSTLDYFDSLETDAATTVALTLGAILNEYHPTLVSSILNDSETTIDPVISELGSSVISFLMRSALESYRKNCVQ